MAVDTSFDLVAETTLRTWEHDSAQLQWLLYGGGDPEDAGWPNGFSSRSTGCEWKAMRWMTAVATAQLADVLKLIPASDDDLGGLRKLLCERRHQSDGLLVVTVSR